MKRNLACAGALVLLGCGDVDSSPPDLKLATEVTCETGASCVTEGVEAYEVSGVRVLHKRLPGHPMVAVQLSFSSENLSGKQGWAESLACTLFALSGSRRFTSSSWNAELLKHGASVSANRATDYSHIDLLAPLPSWRSVWDLVVESVSQPPFSSYDLDYYRLQYQRGFMSERDDPAAAAGIDAFSRQFQGDAFNLLRDGKDELTGLALDDVFYAWHDFFERRRLLVTVVGDVDRRAVNAAVGALARWLYPDAAPSFPAQPVNKLAQFDLEVLKYADSPNWYIDSYFRGPVASSPDYAAFSLGLEVLDQRLFREVRDVRGLAYTTGARASFYRNSYGHLWLASEAPREALPVASQLIADLQTLGPDQDELQSARARMRTELYGYGDEPAGLASLIADWELTAGAHEALEDYLIELDSAQPAQVAAALSAYLRNVKTCAAGGGSELIEEDLSPLFASP